MRSARLPPHILLQRLCAPSWFWCLRSILHWCSCSNQTPALPTQRLPPRPHERGYMLAINVRNLKANHHNWGRLHYHNQAGSQWIPPIVHYNWTRTVGYNNNFETYHEHLAQSNYFVCAAKIRPTTPKTILPGVFAVHCEKPMNSKEAKKEKTREVSWLARHISRFTGSCLQLRSLNGLVKM